jgi:hypothetical protein
MSHWQHCLITVMAVLLMGCQGDREVRGKEGSSTPGVSSTHAAGTTSSDSTSVQTSSAPAPTSTAPGSDGGFAGSTAYTEKLGQEGMVDWTAGIVTASGIGYPPSNTDNPTQARLLARRAAQSVAYRNLLEAFKAIRVDSLTMVSNYVTTKDEIEVRISGMLQGVKEINSRELQQGGYEVTLQMKLTGEASAAFAPKDAPAPKRLVQDIPPSARPRQGGPYTGLVVDARGMEVRPALVPRILTEDGQEAYSQSYVLAKYRQNQGTAYVSDPVEAKTHPKVTDNPLYVKALRPAGNSHTDLVISNAAAQTIHGVKDHFEFLEKGQVIVVIDRSGRDETIR